MAGRLQAISNPLLLCHVTSELEGNILAMGRPDGKLSLFGKVFIGSEGCLSGVKAMSAIAFDFRINGLN